MKITIDVRQSITNGVTSEPEYTISLTAPDRTVGGFTFNGRRDSMYRLNRKELETICEELPKQLKEVLNTKYI